jgi:hypothetical protein
MLSWMTLHAAERLKVLLIMADDLHDIMPRFLG